MPNKIVPRLCGGTFFLQILRMKNPKSRSNAAGMLGEKDSVNNQRVLEALIRFFKPNFQVYSDGTFKGDTSDYRACKEATGDNLPFDEGRTNFAPFDLAVKNEYAKVLPVMKHFVNRFINTDEPEKIEEVTKALLQLIADDDSIKPADVFYMGEMGHPITKEKLLQKTDIILESFLLGIWHFILLNRQDNHIGRETFLDWNRQNGPRTPWKYVSTIGRDYPIAIRIRKAGSMDFFVQPEPVEEPAAAAEPEYEEEILEEDTDTYESEVVDDPVMEEYKTLLLQQNVYINNGVIMNFTQNAEKIYYINNVEHLD